MTVNPLPCVAQTIKDAPGLDWIYVYWSDVEPGKGHVTITCYGSAWCAYFGGMPGDTIRQFFQRADTSYLVTKLGITPQLKQTKQHANYLAKIIDAVKASLAEKQEDAA